MKKIKFYLIICLFIVKRIKFLLIMKLKFLLLARKNNEIMILNNKKQKNSLLYISEFDIKIQKIIIIIKMKNIGGILADFCKKKNLKLNVALRSNRKDKR